MTPKEKAIIIVDLINESLFFILSLLFTYTLFFY
jgi:hypothetical protein